MPTCSSIFPSPQSPDRPPAIIGSTGAGKSSLLNLIPRFFDVSYGHITIDGIDIRNLSLHKLHEVLGYVPQKGVLFSGDIESNLKVRRRGYLGRPDGAGCRDCTGDRVHREQTRPLPGRPSHRAAPTCRAVRKQRLSIARAIAKNPKIYLFDDSFSALDYKTDAALRRALSERVHDATTIIVAQRISTILHAEQIIVLDEGKVAGIGTHEELMKTCATYQEIARSQLSEKEVRRDERMSQRPMRAPMRGGHGMMPGEKAKDFKGSTLRLLSYMGKFKLALIGVLLFAVGSLPCLTSSAPRF